RELAERLGSALTQLGEARGGGLPLGIERGTGCGDGLLGARQALLGLAQLTGGTILVVLGGGQRLAGAGDGLDHLALGELLAGLQLAAGGVLLGVGGLLLGLGLPRGGLRLTEHLLGAGQSLRGIIRGPGGAEPGERGMMHDRLLVLLALLDDTSQRRVQLLVLL